MFREIVSSNTCTLFMSRGFDSLKVSVRIHRENLSISEIAAKKVLGSQMRHSVTVCVTRHALLKLSDKLID